MHVLYEVLDVLIFTAGVTVMRACPTLGRRQHLIRP